jgi:hypothetical protein
MRLKNQAPNTLESAKLSEREEDSLSKAIAFFKEISGEDTEVASKLEIMSSLHFLWCVSYFKTKPKEEILRKVHEKKDWVTPDDLEKSWELLNKHGLLA